MYCLKLPRRPITRSALHATVHSTDATPKHGKNTHGGGHDYDDELICSYMESRKKNKQ